MAGTNPAPVDDDDKPVTEDDLRALKYPEAGVETPKEEDEPAEEHEPVESEEAAEDEDQIEAEASDGEESPPAFVKQFDNIKGDTPEEYAKNLEEAYRNSTSEAVRLKGELDKTQPAPTVTPPAEETSDTPPAPKTATDLFVEQELQKKIQGAYAKTQQEYPQVNDPTEYAKFTQKVSAFSRTIIDSEGRLAEPEELYNMAALSLGWEKKTVEPDEAERLAIAAKNGAAASKTSAAPGKPKTPGPKISEAQLVLNRKMYPGKTDAEIIEELTPYLT